MGLGENGRRSLMLQFINWPWYGDWIKTKQAEHDARATVTTLCSEDSSWTRARKICEHAGITMDHNMMALLPAMVEALDAYKQLDEEARLQQ
jgi:hypothetical protein